jgi:hypothetical protein
MNPNTSTNAEPLNVASFHARRRPDGHVNHGDPILDRHDYRDWVEWPSGKTLPDGTRVRHEWVTGPGPYAPSVYVHPDDVPTDPDTELVERVADALADSYGFTFRHLIEQDKTDFRTSARGVIALVRAHDKADR